VRREFPRVSDHVFKDGARDDQFRHGEMLSVFNLHFTWCFDGGQMVQVTV
jgi:hypothetical protein